MEKFVGGLGVVKHEQRYQQSGQLGRKRDTISWPSPYYWGDYRTNCRPIRDYIWKEEASSTSKKSSTASQATISDLPSVWNSCFTLKDRESTPNFLPKKTKLNSSGKEISKRLQVLHIRVGCVLTHTMKFVQRYGQLNPNKRDDEHMSTVEECRRKVMRAKGLLISSEIETSANQEMEVQFLWAEKWRPKRLTDFICNKQQARDLQFLVDLRHCPHMIFEGPPGAGKSSLIRAMIGEIFHSKDNQIRQGKITIHLQENLVTRMVVPIKASSIHMELNLNSLGGYEMNVVDLLMKNHNYKIISNSVEYLADCKVIVLDGADMLANDAQHYIRWLMERHQDSCKLIFCCSNANKIQTISSLCKIVKVDNPSIEQIVQVLEHVANKEGINLPRPYARRIAENSNKNLPQAIRSLEATIRSRYPFTENQNIITGWEDHIARIAKCVVDEQSPKQLYDIRVKLQMLSMHYVSPKFVFMTLVEELKQHLDDNLKSKLQNLCVAYSRHCPCDGDPLTQNQKDQDHVEDMKRKANLYSMIEEFTARFMSLYKAADIKKKCATENQNESSIWL